MGLGKENPPKSKEELCKKAAKADHHRILGAKGKRVWAKGCAELRAF
jgi:hypothetical protein